MRHFYAWGGVLFLLLSRGALAYTGLSGMPPLALTGEVTVLPTLQRPGVLRVIVRGEYASDQTAKVEIHLPPGIDGERKDLIRTAHTYGDSSDSEWDIEIQPRRAGVFEITGTMTVDLGGDYGRDEADFRTQLYVGADTVWATHGQPTRFERVKGSQRYRYGGAYLVPISRSEVVSLEDILEHAAVVEKKPAKCKSCDLDPHGTTVNLVVFLDENGHITELRPLPSNPPSGEPTLPEGPVLAAAERAVRSWVFSPSRTTTRPVADFVFVKVDVLPDE